MQALARPLALAAWVRTPGLLVVSTTAPLMRNSCHDGLRDLAPLLSLRRSTPRVTSQRQFYSTTQSPASTKETRNQDLPPSVTEQLPSTKDSRRDPLTRRFSHVMDNLQSSVLTASHTLNDMTGYSAIEAIKANNELLEQQLATAQSQVRAARQAYKTSNTRRATTQREVTTLLARKDSWSPADLERFTELYRTDHVLEGEVAAAQEALNEAEVLEQSLGQRLNAGILKRYHEEQIWSDRIRRASTWGTWGIMGMNFILFVVLQFVAEPWRRRRLVKGVVEEEQAVLQEVRAELEAVKLGLDRATTVAATSVDAAPGNAKGLLAPESAEASNFAMEAHAPSIWSWREVWYNPRQWGSVATDLYSERHLDLRMKDATMLALQGAFVGATMAAGMAFLLLRRT